MLKAKAEQHRDDDREGDRCRDAVPPSLHQAAPFSVTGAAKTYPPLRTVLISSGSFGSDFDPVAQPADMDVDAAIGHGRRPSPREVEQLVTRQHMLWPLHESQQQVELGDAQIDQRFCRRVELTPRHIETPAGELEYAAAPAGDPGTGMDDRRNTARTRASSSRVLKGFGR